MAYDTQWVRGTIQGSLLGSNPMDLWTIKKAFLCPPNESKHSDFPPSVTAKTPVSSCCRIKSEAKVNNVLRHNPRVNYFACSLKIGFAFMKSIRLMTLINEKGNRGRSGKNKNLKWFKHKNTSCSTMPAGLFCQLKCVHHSHFFLPQTCNTYQGKGLLVSNYVFTKAES